MIKITENSLEVDISVKTEAEKLMCSIDKEAFEMASISAHIRVMIATLIQKYGKEKTLHMFTIPITDLFGNEDFDKVLNSEEEDNE